MPTEKRREVQDGLILGIDIGSVSISVVSLDSDGMLHKDDYALHHGDIRGTLDRMLKGYESSKILGIASPSGKAHFVEQVHVYDQQLSLMEAVRSLGLKARSILHVGAERFFLMELDQGGGYLQTSHSSSCAAGTGRWSPSTI